MILLILRMLSSSQATDTFFLDRVHTSKCDFVRPSVLSFVRMLVPRLWDEQDTGYRI